MKYPEDMMPTPCACCEHTTDFRNLVDDPLGEYDMICTVCADDRRRHAEERQRYDYEHRMPDYQKHIR